MRKICTLLLCACVLCACLPAAICEGRGAPDVVGANAFGKQSANENALKPFSAEDAAACLSFGGVQRLSDYVDALSPASCEWTYSAEDDTTRLTLTGACGGMTVSFSGSALGAQNGRMVGAPDGDVLLSRATLIGASWTSEGLPLAPPREIVLGATFDRVLATYGVTAPGEDGSLYDETYAPAEGAANATSRARGILETSANGETQIALEAYAAQVGGGYRLVYQFSGEKVSAILLCELSAG